MFSKFDIGYFLTLYDKIFRTFILPWLENQKNSKNVINVVYFRLFLLNLLFKIKLYLGNHYEKKSFIISLFNPSNQLC